MLVIRTEFWKIYWLTGCGFISKDDERNTLLSALSPFLRLSFGDKKNILFCDYNNNLVYIGLSALLTGSESGLKLTGVQGQWISAFPRKLQCRCSKRDFGESLEALTPAKRKQEDPRETPGRHPEWSQGDTQKDPEKDPKKTPGKISRKTSRNFQGRPTGRPQEDSQNTPRKKQERP